jgi:hypothetical protein
MVSHEPWRIGLGNLPRPVFDEFIRCYTPKTIKGTCHDYVPMRGSIEMDAADKDSRSHALLILWGTRGGRQRTNIQR